MSDDLHHLDRKDNDHDSCVSAREVIYVGFASAFAAILVTLLAVFLYKKCRTSNLRFSQCHGQQRPVWTCQQSPFHSTCMGAQLEHGSNLLCPCGCTTVSPPSYQNSNSMINHLHSGASIRHQRTNSTSWQPLQTDSEGEEPSSVRQDQTSSGGRIGSVNSLRSCLRRYRQNSAGCPRQCAGPNSQDGSQSRVMSFMPNSSTACRISTAALTSRPSDRSTTPLTQSLRSASAGTIELQYIQRASIPEAHSNSATSELQVGNGNEDTALDSEDLRDSSNPDDQNRRSSHNRTPSGCTTISTQTEFEDRVTSTNNAQDNAIYQRTKCSVIAQARISNRTKRPISAVSGHEASTRSFGTVLQDVISDEPTTNHVEQEFDNAPPLDPLSSTIENNTARDLNEETIPKRIAENPYLFSGAPRYHTNFNFLGKDSDKEKRDKMLHSLTRAQSTTDDTGYFDNYPFIHRAVDPEVLCAPTGETQTSLVHNKLLAHKAKVFDSNGGELRLDKLGISLRVPPLAVPAGRQYLLYLVLNWDLTDNPELSRREAQIAPVVFCGPLGVTFDKPCILLFKHCTFDSRYARVMCSSTGLFERKIWTSLDINHRDVTEQDNVPATGARKDQEYYRNDECQVKLRHFGLFTCVQSSRGKRLKKYLQVAVFTRDLDPNFLHHELRVCFLNRTPCALQWAIQNEAAFNFSLCCPVMDYLFEESGESMIVTVDYLSDGWHLVGTDRNQTTVQFEHIWHATCPFASLTFRRERVTSMNIQSTNETCHIKETVSQRLDSGSANEMTRRSLERSTQRLAGGMTSPRTDAAAIDLSQNGNMNSEINIDLVLSQECCENKTTHVNVLLFQQAGHGFDVTVPTMNSVEETGY